MASQHERVSTTASRAADRAREALLRVSPKEGRFCQLRAPLQHQPLDAGELALQQLDRPFLAPQPPARKVPRRQDEAPGERRDARAELVYTERRPDGTAGQLVPVETLVRDARPALAAGDLSLAEQGFTLARQRTALRAATFYHNDRKVREVYYREMAELIARETGANRVVVLDHVVRNAGLATARGKANPFSSEPVNGYANVVHSDFRSEKSAEKFVPYLRDNFGGKVMLINAWRNISDEHPIYNHTLACCDQRTVSADRGDYVKYDLPQLAKSDRTLKEAQKRAGGAHRLSYAEQYRLSSHSAERHAWYYFPRMTRDEVLLFTQFDSDTRAPARLCFHTAFEDPAADPGLPPRETVEVRAIAFFEDRPAGHRVLEERAAPSTLRLPRLEAVGTDSALA